MRQLYLPGIRRKPRTSPRYLRRSSTGYNISLDPSSINLEGLRQFASSIAAPVSLPLDYQGVARAFINVSSYPGADTGVTVSGSFDPNNPIIFTHPPLLPMGFCRNQCSDLDLTDGDNQTRLSSAP